MSLINNPTSISNLIVFWVSDSYVFWQFFLELLKVPRVESKLRVFSFKIQFCSQVRWPSILLFYQVLSGVVVTSAHVFRFFQVSDLRTSLNIINSTSEEVSYVWIIVFSCIFEKVFLIIFVSYTTFTVVLIRSGIQSSWKGSCKPFFPLVMPWTMELQEVS